MNTRLATIITALLTAMSVGAQQATFVSEGFEERIRDFLQLEAGAPVLQTQIDTITAISFRGMGIKDIHDAVYLTNVRSLDLSGNNISDLAPLLVALE